MAKLPLVKGVLNYISENNISFSTPGHKAGKGFMSTGEGEELYKSLVKCDLTEVEGLDNLHNPKGIIKAAQEKLSEFYGSKRSYFLVNGSTSGNLTMIFSAFNEGDKVIVERNCHKSIFNGIILRKLKPVYIKNKINHKFDAPLSIDEEHFLNIIKENKDAKGIIITYPNYYGVCANLKHIIDEARKWNMKVLVDAAHGAHFGAAKALPENPLKLGANMVVMSSHKTLPSLTQTAFLHVGEGIGVERVELYLRMFLSTSPSYMLMCSMDYARYYLEHKGKQDYERLINTAEKYRDKINKIKGLHILGIEDLTEENNSLDPTRYVINMEKGYSAGALSDYLRKNKIQPEMNDGQNVILIFSPFNEEEDFKKLYEVLKECDLNELKTDYCNILNHNIPKSMLIPYEAIDKEAQYIELQESEGRICADSIIPYPPGVPLVNIGEVIDKYTINAINYYVNNKIEVIGVLKGKKNYSVKVIKA